MNKFIFLLSSLLLFTSCSQELHYSISETYTSGQKKSVEVMENGRLIKKVYYSEDGAETVVETYNQQNLVSQWIAEDKISLMEAFTEYFGNGSLKKTGYHIGKKMNGNWSYYNRHNHIEAERYFFNDEPTGIWVWYDNNHQVLHMEEHDNIKSNGRLTEYYLSGQVKRVSFYNNGSLDGIYVTYYENGKIKLSGQYLNNHKEGMWSLLDERGQLERVESYDNGLLHGQWKQLYSNGQVKFQGKYVNNKRAGQWVWYDIGGNDTHSEIY